MLTEEQIKTIEEQGYDIKEYDDYYYVSRYSDLGEDFGFEVSKSNALEEIINYCDNFSPDEHSSMWIEARGTRGVPDSSYDLVMDAIDINENLTNLANALRN